MKTVYDEYSLCRSSVVEFYKRLLEGRELVEDYALTWQAHRVITPETIVEVNGSVMDNPHCLSSTWNGKPPSMPSVIKTLYKTVDEPSIRNAQAFCPMALFSCIISPRHAANAVKTTLQQCKWETLEPLPYTPDISQCVFHVSGPLKRGNQGH
ncbi:uncharacterized protein TNCV_3662561 [Trichonephila clavipes]|nr:uncharacterized protein TNCV_3662561 [Trichonephila clavipes]